MTCYTSSGTLRHLTMTDVEWNTFLDVIQMDCRFSRNCINLHSTTATKRILHKTKFNIKYYLKGDNQHFIVSNDDRHKIVAYLRDEGLIKNLTKKPYGKIE